MINASTPTVPLDQPPPPPEQEQEKVSVANDDDCLSPTLTQMSDNNDFSGSDTVSSDDEGQQNRRGVKRQWRQTTAASQSQDPATSSPPALKRQRTAANVAPESETFSRHYDADLIALVRKHGGQILDRQGDMIVLTLPPRDNLQFKVEFTCLKLEMLRAGKPFAGREAFLPAAFGAFYECLEAATLANQGGWVRSLLATGMGKNAGELLRDLALRAASAGAHEAFDAITDDCAYWAQGDGAFTSGWAMDSHIRVGDSDRPPADWRSSLRQTFSKADLQELLTCFRINDTNAALSLLFNPEQRPATGQFHVRALKHLDNRLRNWLFESGAGAFTKSNDATLIVYSTDFNRHMLAEKLQLLHLENGGNVDHAAESALFLAAMWGDLDIFQSLLAQETNALSQKPYAAPTLRAAAEVGAIEIVRCLLAYGIDINLPDLMRGTALTMAAAAGRTAVCTLLLDHGALLEPPPLRDDNEDDEDSSEDQECPTALIAAASAGQTSTCAFLIMRGAGIDSRRCGTYAALIAAKNGWAKTCQLLVVAGARLDQPDTQGRSILSHAARTGNIALYEFLQSRGADPGTGNSLCSPLIMAAKADRTAMVTHLLQTLQTGLHRQDLKLQKYTALLEACESGAVDTIKLLLSHGAPVDHWGSIDNNALHAAIHGGSLPSLQLILPLFSESDSEYRLVALNQAISRDRFDMVCMFPAAMMNPVRSGLNAKDNPLLEVRYSQSLIEPGGWQARHHILMYLLDSGVPRHHVNEKGNDALMLATIASDARAISILLNAGMRIGQANKNGMHAMQLALANTYEPIDFARSQIFRELGQALLRQDNHLPLLDDLLVQQKDPIKRDMCAYFFCALTPLGIPGIGSLPLREQELMERIVRPHIMFPGKAPKRFEKELPLSLAKVGITTPLIDLLMPSLRMLRQIRVELFGTHVAGNEQAFQAAVDGIYLTLEPKRSQLAEKISACYIDQTIDGQWKAALMAHSNGWLSERIETASSREHLQIASTFSNLYSLCADIALAGQNYPDALKRPAIPKGEIASALLHKGVYAALATRIETAWINAWQRVAEQSDLKHTGHSAPNELEPELDLFDDPWALPEMPNWLEAPPADVALPENPVSSFEEALLSEFRSELKAVVDSPSTSGNVLSVTNVSPDAAALYSDLMFRQLHMLAQFIHPEISTN